MKFISLPKRLVLNECKAMFRNESSKIDNDIKLIRNKNLKFEMDFCRPTQNNKFHTKSGLGGYNMEITTKFICIAIIS